MGRQNGHGTVTSKDGKYVEEWKGNDFTDGTKWVGDLRGNKPWNLSLFDKNGNIKRKWVNGEYIKQ